MSDTSKEQNNTNLGTCVAGIFWRLIAAILIIGGSYFVVVLLLWVFFMLP